MSQTHWSCSRIVEDSGEPAVLVSGSAWASQHGQHRLGLGSADVVMCTLIEATGIDEQ